MIAFDSRTEKGMLAGIIEFPDVRYRIEEIDPIYLSEDGKKIFFCIRDSLAEDDVMIYRKIMNMGLPVDLMDEAPASGETTGLLVDRFQKITQRMKLAHIFLKNGELLSKEKMETDEALEDVWRFQRGAAKSLQIKKSEDVSHENMDRSESIWAGRYGDIQWPYGRMNDILNGLMGGELVVIAGQPGMGKSALMGSLAYEWAQRGIASGFVALEMKAVDIQNRLLQRLFKKSLAKEMKYLTKEERVEFSKAVASFAKLPIFFVDNGNSTLSAVATSIKTMHMLYGIKAAFVDYLQLMRTSGGETRDTEIGIMTRTLKQLAMELNIPVIIGSQLNRRTENNEDGRPRLSNLRESGNIEQDADIVAFVYRPIFYAPKGRKKKGDETEEVSENDFEIIVSKQRNGMLGTIHLKYNTERQIISEV